MMQEEKNELIEALASIEHDQWMTWAKNLMQKETLTTDRFYRWSRLLVPYAQLTETEKEQDREYARKVLAAFKAHFKDVKIPIVQGELILYLGQVDFNNW